MSQTLTELQAETSRLSAELKALEASREVLHQERVSFQAVVSFPADSSPKALAEFQQQQAVLAAKRVERLQEIAREIRALDLQIQQKQAILGSKQAVLDQLLHQQLEERLLVEGQRLQVQADKINQFAAQLEAELRVLKAMYEEINPLYCQWLQQPSHIIKFSAKTIPHVFLRSDGFELGNQEIDWEGKGVDQ